VALGHSIRTLDLPLSLFDDLLSAFGQDTMTTRYASWQDVFDYCRRSANPVGRLVLRIAGYRDDALDRSSDALCTALQLTNFWQDFGRDWRAGRIYVPRQVMDTYAAGEADLVRGVMSPAWVQAIGACASVTRDWFRDGRAVCDGVQGRLKIELRLTWLGGRRILERVEHARADLLTHRPTLGSTDVPGLLWRAARWAGAAA
jgi:squalene synthase HpnC